MEESKLLKKKRKARSDGNKTALISVCTDLANLYKQQNRHNLVVNEFIEVSNIYKELGKHLDYALANRMIGEAYMQLREFDKALQHQQIYLEVAKKGNVQVEVQRAYATIGHIYLTRHIDAGENSDKGDLNLAFKTFTKSLQVCESLKGISKTEHMDMIARLFTNLGLVHENFGNYEKASELVHKSIKICKDHEFHEQLERNYTCLGSLFIRQQEYEKAIEQVNLAIEVAGRLPNKRDLIASSLAVKGDILVRLADLRGAKNVLLKAYKMKTSNLAEAESIEINLKVVAAMCNAEECILISGENEHKKKRSLYEKLGDGSCHFKNFAKAVEYYHKMLVEAVSSGDKGKDLSPCYISLAQTYRDMKLYTKALPYFYKDYEQCKDNLKESVSTLLYIVETMEMAGEELEEIERKYEEILALCEREADIRLKARVLRKFGEFLRTKMNETKARLVENQLEQMDVNSSDGESEDANTPNIGEDINISEITDISDGSDAESSSSKPRTLRKRREKVLKVTRNAKGETQLHRACTEGNLELVERLITLGHPVNARDFSGWLPLHEACNFGHLAVVEVLLDNGASINDREGTLCAGLTPLHDAASNGHLEIIQLLLDRGANALAKTDDGDTALHVLRQWRCDHELPDGNQSELYERIEKRMSVALEKSGHVENAVNDRKCSALVTERRETSKSTRVPQDWSPLKTVSRSPSVKGGSSGKKRSPRNESRPNTSKIGAIRRNLEVEDYNFTSNVQSGSVTDEYRSVMENVRRQSGGPSERKRKSSDQPQPALITVDDDVDDWLEDDLGNKKVTKKRKTRSVENLMSTSNTRTTNDDNNWENIPDSLDPKPSQTRKSNKRTTQASLIRVGFTRHLSDSSDSRSPHRNVPCERRKQTKLTAFTSDDPDNVVSSSNDVVVQKMEESAPVTTVMSLDVRIETRLYRVPVMASELQTRTVRWLADEAAKRYFKREGVKPILELETKNGAILADEDVISMLFPAGSNQGEEVIARILKQTIPTFSERYEEACATLNTDPNENLRGILREVSTNLDLHDLCLRSVTLEPVCQALNRQSNLLELNLSGNLMSDKCATRLCAALPTLTSLSSLNLSLNNLTSQTLRCICDTFSKCDTPILENLRSLDLSYNPLGNESLPFLAVTTRYLRLRTLRLRSVKFTAELFKLVQNRNMELCLENVVAFDVSENSLGKDELLKFVPWLNLGAVEVLNLSNNAIQDEGFVGEVARLFGETGDLQLTDLNLAGCKVADSDVFELLKALTYANKFERLDLSNNEKLTAFSLRRLLTHYPSLARLDLHDCPNIMKYFDGSNDDFWTFAHCNARRKVHECTVNLDCRKLPQEYAILCRMWEDNYGNKFKVQEVLRDVLKFYVLL